MKNIISINFTNSGAVDLVTRLNTGTNELWVSVQDANGGNIDLGTGSTVSITSDNFSYQINSALWVGADALTIEISKSSTTYTYTINKVDELAGDIYIQKNSATVFTLVKKQDSRRELTDFFYPVGSYYETTDTTFDPNVTWGGTWELEAEGLVHISSGENYAVTSNSKDGGDTTHRHEGSSNGGDLRAAIGSPNGDASRLGFIATGASNPVTGQSMGNCTYRVPASTSSVASGGTFSHYTPVYGYTSTKSNMQPYKIVNRWHRTA